jgi:hypothetical protein
MRITRLIFALAVPMLLIACDQNDPTAPDPPQLKVGAANAPIPFPFFDQFDDLNPCTGLFHTITVTGTQWRHEHNNNLVVREKSTITTSDGFEGKVSATDVTNFSGANVYKSTFNSMLTHPDGAKIRAHFVLVVDLETGTVRVFKFAADCVRPFDSVE